MWEDGTENGMTDTEGNWEDQERTKGQGALVQPTAETTIAVAAAAVFAAGTPATAPSSDAMTMPTIEEQELEVGSH